MRTRRFALVLSAATLVLAVSGAAPAASFAVLHSFAGPDGQTPAAPLVQGADGFLYGVAAHGGDLAVLPPDGGGTAFRVDAAGTFTTLHVFTGPDGAVPNSLVQGRDGFFYGTTSYGGRAGISALLPGNGTIFRMDAAGAVTVLHVFGGASEGKFPGPIVQGADGALYGSAIGGVQISPGIYGGFVYRFDPATGDFRHLHDFVVSDGRTPTGPLFQATDGFLYGTTNQGGAWNAGVVYKVDALGRFVLLHSLSPLFPGEGSQPKGGVIQASDGFFYGTTELGGYGGGIFRMDAAGNLTVVHRFDAYASDGSRPLSGLIEGRDGFLYGTAPIGGQPVDGIRRGVVFRMSTAGAVTVLHTFTGPDGSTPWAAPVQAADGALYGSTVVGGAFGRGVLFRVDAAAAGPAPAPVLAALTLAPATVIGRRTSVGTVSLSGPAPAGGVVVALASDAPAVASVPATVKVAAGATSASFTVSTRRVTRRTTVTITATWGRSVSATLTVTR
jgi:uncharacterized repeat protein (TIGR03803 family)